MGDEEGHVRCSLHGDTTEGDGVSDWQPLDPFDKTSHPEWPAIVHAAGKNWTGRTWNSTFVCVGVEIGREAVYFDASLADRPHDQQRGETDMRYWWHPMPTLPADAVM